VYYALRNRHVVYAIVRDQGATPQLPRVVAGRPNVPGFSGDGGLASNALLNQPCGVAVDADGSILILDAANFRVRRCRRFP
jgi:hypothetical protein